MRRNFRKVGERAMHVFSAIVQVVTVGASPRVATYVRSSIFRRSPATAACSAFARWPSWPSTPTPPSAAVLGLLLRATDCAKEPLDRLPHLLADEVTHHA